MVTLSFSRHQGCGRHRFGRIAAALVLAALLAAVPGAQQWPGPGERVADGLDFYKMADPALLSPPGPVAVQLLRLDPRKVDLAAALADDRIPAKETVPAMARRRGAIAAINAGFFVVATGAPAGLLKVDGRLLGTTSLHRGAVGIRPMSGRQPLRLLFDQVAAPRRPGREGQALWRPRLGSSSKDWARARDAVGGAGLLRRAGRDIRPTEWVPEKMAAGFIGDRHPRTMIGVDASGAIWLVTVDGRNPFLSLGMTLRELQGLAGRLGLREALNLDGGGSTTMVVKGEVVNHPSDATGPRPVSDALLVHVRNAAKR